MTRVGSQRHKKKYIYKTECLEYGPFFRSTSGVRVRRVIEMFLSVCYAFEMLKQFTDFHETTYEHCFFGGHFSLCTLEFTPVSSNTGARERNCTGTTLIPLSLTP